MGIKNCEIKLDNPWNTYYAGQTINGQVILTFDSPKKVRGITITYNGKAETQFHIKVNLRNRSTITKLFTGSEVYFNKYGYLLGTSENIYDTELFGAHTYNFSFNIPSTVPTSYEDKFGYIRHTIKISIQYSITSIPYDEYVKAFTVVSPVHLNAIVGAADPQSMELERNFCTCFCQNDRRISVITAIPVTGYVPGQSIPITCVYRNSTNIIIDKIKFRLHKLLKIHVNTPDKRTINGEFRINQISIGPLSSNLSKPNIYKLFLKIPPLPSTNFKNCSLIQLQYHLFVEIESKNLPVNPKGSIPITIGTVPLNIFMQNVPRIEANSNSNCDGGATTWDSFDSTSQSFYYTVPPIFSKYHTTVGQYHQLNDENNTCTYLLDDDNLDFAPRYPTFPFDPSFDIFNNQNNENVTGHVVIDCNDTYTPVSISGDNNDGMTCHVIGPDDQNCDYVDFMTCHNEMSYDVGHHGNEGGRGGFLDIFRVEGVGYDYDSSSCGGDHVVSGDSGGGGDYGIGGDHVVSGDSGDYGNGGDSSGGGDYSGGGDTSGGGDYGGGDYAGGGDSGGGDCGGGYD